MPNNSMFELRCRATGNPSPQVSWFKNDICIDRSRNFTIGENEGEFVLRMDHVSPEDDKSKFTIKVTNELGSGREQFGSKRGDFDSIL